MPRNEQRPVIFAPHALRRAAQRKIDLAVAEQLVRHGAVRPDADADFVAYGTVAGRVIEVAFDDNGDHLWVKTVY